MICGAVEITPCSVRHSAVSRTQSGDGYLVAGLREIETTGAAFEQVEGALVEGVGAVRDAGAERIGIFASGELRGTRVAGRISVEARRLGLGEGLDQLVRGIRPGVQEFGELLQETTFVFMPQAALRPRTGGLVGHWDTGMVATAGKIIKYHVFPRTIGI